MDPGRRFPSRPPDPGDRDARLIVVAWLVSLVAVGLGVGVALGWIDPF